MMSDNFTDMNIIRNIIYVLGEMYGILCLFVHYLCFKKNSIDSNGCTWQQFETI